MTSIYVGNISYAAEENDLQDLFGQFGEVTSVKIIKDRDTGRSKGFGFIEMADEESGNKAIENLNGHDLQGRQIKVTSAKPKRQ